MVSMLKPFYFSDTPNAGQIEIIHDKMRQFRRQIYIPNIHPKLIKFLRSSSARRRHLEEDIARKGFDIVWPQTEEGNMLHKFHITHCYI